VLRIKRQKIVKFHGKFTVREGWKPFVLNTYDHI